MERECEEGEIEKKLRRSFLVGNYSRRAGPSTPPPTWRLGLSPPRVGASSSAVVETKEFLVNSDVSVRKLCADLWETEQFQPPCGLQRCRRRDSDVESPCGGPLHDHQTPSRGSSRRQIAATLESTDDHRFVQRNGDLLQPVTPSSCSNRSFEVVVRKSAFSQTGSSVAKPSSYGLGSSTKLLKVLNRIWTLEEQNAANVSLVKALKMELDECRAEIKGVQHREKQSDRRIRKKKEEEEELKEVFRSITKELDDEREVRKKSESMHRKLTRELCEAKHCLTKALKDVEKERKERVLVEDLCDEFAKAVKDYEDKVRRNRNKSPVSDQVIVQIAQVWTHKRLQRKLEEDDKEDLVSSAKLGFDAEMFLRAEEKRRSHSSKSDLRAKPDDSTLVHQRACLKELQEGLEKRTRRDNKLQLKRSDQVLNLSMSSEGDKIHPEATSPRKANDRESFSKILPRNVMVREGTRSLKDKLMEARVESRRLRSLKPESSPSHPVQA